MKKVLVAMSGGVDSSVAAALLQKQGYFVAGAYMKNFSPESWAGVMESDCPWGKDVADAKAVCKTLGIKFRSFNFEKEYRVRVIDYFFAEYKAGRTPNPDIMCNKKIKFGLFLKRARELGFDYIATGHYARVVSLRCQRPKQSRADRHVPPNGGTRDDKFSLFKSRDPKKDQSYFLYPLTQKQLAHTLFPIGEHTKQEVRRFAKKFGLPNWNKKDSQGICFVGHVNLREFLRQRIPERAGDIVDTQGKILGRHRGAWYYTIGQRHGLGVGARPPSLRLGVNKQDGKPYYVTKKDVKRNRVTVAEGRYNRLVYYTLAKIGRPHWINKKPVFTFSCKAKIRYRQKEQNCRVSKSKRGYTVKFAKPQFAIASGQSIVFYRGNRVLGGGIIS